MATLKQLRSSIRGQIRGQVPSDETRYRDRFLDHEIRAVRSQLIKEFARRNVGIPNDFYQRICCLEVQCDQIICNGVPLPHNTPYIQLPSLENVPFNPAYIGTVDGRWQFSRIPFTSFHFYTGGSFNRMQPAFALIEDKALLKLPHQLAEVKTLCLYGILEDPTEDTCITLTENDPYPLPNNLVHQLEIMVLKQLMSTLSIPADTENSSADEQATQPMPKTR